MSNLRRQAASALADMLFAEAKLREKPAVIAAPPSEVSDYPRAAVWLEKFETRWAQDDEYMVDSTGEILTGARATLVPPAGAAMLDSVAHLSSVGVLVGSGRIWLGCRLAPLREQMEDVVSFIFNRDSMAPSRALIPIHNPRIGSYSLSWDWNVACFLDGATWSAEYAFAERLWSWIDFEMEIDILIPRFDPLIRQMIIEIAAGPDVDPSDLASLQEHYLISADGSVTPAN